MPDPIAYVETYFTFGQDHFLPNGNPAKDEYVIVSTPENIDPRMILIAFLGSNGFSDEYTSQRWSQQNMNERYYKDRSAAYHISVIERAGDGY